MAFYTWMQHYIFITLVLLLYLKKLKLKPLSILFADKSKNRSQKYWQVNAFSQKRNFMA